MEDIYLPNIDEYKYSERHTFYRSEKLEISPEELEKINSFQRTSVSPVTIPPPPIPLDVIIDTDIGTDLDDSLALLYSLHLPNINILGITTMYGPSKLRASIAQKICDAYWAYHPEKPHFPIIAGASSSCGSHRSIFLGGHEGDGLFTPEEIEQISGSWKDPNKSKEFNQTSASEFINKTALEHPGLTIISIGIPTNIALALKSNPNLPSKIREIVLMGCGSYFTSTKKYQIGNYSPTSDLWDSSYNNSKYDPPFKLPADDREANQFLFTGHPIILFPNHNLSADTLASKILFDTPNLHIRIIAHAVTSKLWLEGDAITYLQNSAKEFFSEKQNM